MIVVPAEYLIAANRPHAPRWRVSLRTPAGVMIGDYLPITDDEALEAFQICTKLEGIIPALESAHALAALPKLK